MLQGNLFAPLHVRLQAEAVDELVSAGNFRLERIVSLGQATPGGEWYDQHRNEWVVLLSGLAKLRIDGESTDRELTPGDWLLLPAHCRHRVEWTDPSQATVWLALHYESG